MKKESKMRTDLTGWHIRYSAGFRNSPATITKFNSPLHSFELDIFICMSACFLVGKWLACQSMDNQILIFGAQNRFRLNKKKVFKGHMVAGYACQVDFSPDMSYVVSGDADGKLNIWDWKTTKLYHRIKAHDKVCISALWHPHETSKVITCGWDGQIKLWD
ncbi:pre-mRNA-processing factor 17 [Electrophorus electricus]|uniref:pre-mRNA-processing factor 17 n=1 Tax=Electrophorus electricus TaxID=8005 RepID=UPI0015CFEAF6|nr:pre-mRNA-processing factor 17 [Electrophorus electricus]